MKYLDKIPKHKYPWLPIMYKIIYDLKPSVIIEYGTGTGVTAVTMGLALLDLYESTGHVGKIKSYDLFETESKGKYIRDIQTPFTNTNSIELVNSYNLNHIINISHGDFSNFTADIKFDLLYFDIGNHGDNVLDLYNLCKSFVDHGSIILFEGGSYVRDNVEWMKDKRKIETIKNITNYKLISPDERYSVSMIYNSNLYQIL